MPSFKISPENVKGKVSVFSSGKSVNVSYQDEGGSMRGEQALLHIDGKGRHYAKVGGKWQKISRKPGTMTWEVS